MIRTQPPSASGLHVDRRPSLSPVTTLVRKFPLREQEAARCTAERAWKALDCPADQLPGRTMMVNNGGGKDGVFSVAYARLVQLMLEQEKGHTFRLRAPTFRQPGMPLSTLANLRRAYSELGMFGDPRCQLLVLDGTQFRPLTAQGSLDVPLSQREQHRQRVLIAGHQSQGDGRKTFCNDCNLELTHSFLLGCAVDEGVDLVASGDSPKEQRDYYWWTRKVASQLGVPRPAPHLPAILDSLVASGIKLQEAVHGAPMAELSLNSRALAKEPRFFNLFEDASYSAGSHWELLTQTLGFQFDYEGLASSFSETDCANPALMWLLLGLKFEHVMGLGFQAGADLYRDFALGLMEKKDFPAPVVTEMRRRYTGPDNLRARRTQALGFASSAYGLTESNLIGMAHAPFVAGARNLGPYLADCLPGLKSHADGLREVLQATGAPPQSQVGPFLELEHATGLRVSDMRALYRRPDSPALTWIDGMEQPARGTDPLSSVLALDPHKATLVLPNGDLYEVSGR